MRRALTLLAALALGAAPLSAGATTAPTLTLTQQARKADVIVRATLGTPTNVTEGEAIWTVYPLTVTETVAGDPATLPQREGRPVLYVLQGLEDLPELRAGQEAFLLLYSRRMDNPVVGFAQGLYPIVNGRVTRPGESAGIGAPAASGPATPSSSAAATTTPGATTSTTPGTAPSPTVPGTTPPPTTPGADAATVTTPGTAAAPSAPGTGTTTATPAAGSTPAPGSGTTTTTTTPGTTSSTTTPGAGATTATPATGSAPASGSGATAPGTAASSTAPGAATSTTPTPANDPATFPSDPARFRDALRAAREGR